MYTTLITLATAAVAAALPQTYYPAVNSTTTADIQMCGTQPYYPSNYTCYDGAFLCPVVNNRRTQACGDACFDPMEYNCVSGMLMQVSNGRFLNGTVANITAEAGDGVAAPVNVTMSR